ncbi:MAG: DNA primase [bacterium]
MTIPEHKIHEVREATDIVDLVSGYVTLKKSGRNFFGLCPFHTEKTPSFSVNPEKQIFHCFGCGAGGNVFTFLMRHEGISFPESVKLLAQRAGIHLEYEERDESAVKENEAMFYINEFAARFFQESLFSSAGKVALNYLKNRGFELEEIKAFSLGYAPSGWANLITYAKNESIDLQLLFRAGMILQKEGGGYYDRFRDRIMFTIWNLSGRVVAFGGRKLNEEDDSPKYINSPETAVYEKGKLLYGLYQNRDEIRKLDRVIFVEGYTDLMSLVCSGIKNVVATLGTSLTEDHARLIRRYTKNVVLMYDSDTAGSVAALRGADILIENGLEVFMAILPEGQDPDSFVKKHGNQVVLEHLKTATSLFDFKLNQLLLKSSEQRSESIRSLLESLARLKDNIHRSLLLRKVSEKLEIDEKILWNELDTIVRQKRRGEAARSKFSQKFEEVSQVSKKDKADAALNDLIRILIHEWGMADFIFTNLIFENLKESKMLPILHFMKNHYEAKKRPKESELINNFNDIELSSFIINTLNEEWDEMDLKRWAADCISVIEIEKIQIELKEIREEIHRNQKEGKPVKELLQKCMEFEEKKKILQNKTYGITARNHR